MGNDCDTMNTNVQRKNIETDIALPRLRLEKISEITTNAKGPSEIAKNAI